MSINSIIKPALRDHPQKAYLSPMTGNLNNQMLTYNILKYPLKSAPNVSEGATSVAISTTNGDRNVL